MGFRPNTTRFHPVGLSTGGVGGDKAEEIREIAQNAARQSLRHHQARVDESERLFLAAILTARRSGLTFQEMADTLQCSKHWAWKLHQQARESLELEDDD